MISLLWKFKIPILLVLLALLNFGSYEVGRWKGFNEGKTYQEKKTLEKTVQIREAMNEIRNHRPDTDALVNSLLGGTF